MQVIVEWVPCPVCGDIDMRKETDRDGNSLIECTNHACASNGGSYTIERPKATAKKWTLSEGSKLVETLAEPAAAYNLAVGLAGSVVEKGESTNDLDLVLFPYKTEWEDEHLRFLKHIEEDMRLLYVKAVIDHSVNNNDKKLIFRARERISGRAIDLIFAHLKFDPTFKYPYLVIQSKPYNEAVVEATN